MVSDFKPKVAILDLETIRNGLKDKKLYVVADATGLSYPTLKKLADGKDNNPTYDTIKLVSAYLIKTSVVSTTK